MTKETTTITTTKAEESQTEEEEAEEECPICMNTLDAADQLFRLHCRTSSCNYFYCSSCLSKLYDSSKDDYTEASDGSRQVKIQLQCPVCRESYGNQCHHAESVVCSVVLLRSVYRINFNDKDANQSASQLAKRHELLSTTSVADLKQAYKVISQYNRSLPTETIIYPLPTLDWKLYEQHLQPHAVVSQRSSQEQDDFLLRDPTLLLGLHELVTLDEQEFITRLFYSGKPSSLVQGAYLLHSILTSSHSTTRPKSKPMTKNQLKYYHTMRTKYPLPTHMPRTVYLDVYDPLQTTSNKHLPLVFVGGQKNQNTMNCASTNLTLAKVRGQPGRVGVRPRDIVTHVNSEAVVNYGDYVVALQQQQQTSNVFELTVNANQATANVLVERGRRMKEDGVEFW